MLVDQVEGEQRVTQVVEDAHEDHEIKFFVEGSDLPHGHAAELDVQVGYLRGEASLREVVFIGIDAEYALGATALHFERIEPAIAADVEDGLSGKVLRQRIGEALVFDLRVVTEEV